jgi:hypothetical protein
MHVPILSKGLNVRVRKKAVAIETLCVYFFKTMEKVILLNRDESQVAPMSRNFMVQRNTHFPNSAEQCFASS